MGFDPISYAMGAKAGGGGGGVTVEPLSVTANGTYQETGKAYSPVTVSIASKPLISASVTVAGTNQYSISVELPKTAANMLIMVEAADDALLEMEASTSSYYFVVGAMFAYPIKTVTVGEVSTKIFNRLTRYRPSNKVDSAYSVDSMSISGNVLTISTDVTTSFIAGGTYKITIWEAGMS